jgi:hypothetical protein
LLVTLSLLSAPSTSIAAAQNATAGGTSWTPARTPDGQPDLQGFWTAAVAGTYDLTDPRGGEIRLEEVALAARGIVRTPNPSRIIDPPDGKIPYLNGKPRLDMVANFYSERARFIERFTPSGPDTFDYEVTVEDPGVYTRPWKLAARFKRAHPTDYEIFEDACHEGEQSADRMLIPPGAAKPDR